MKTNDGTAAAAEPDYSAAVENDGTQQSGGKPESVQNGDAGVAGNGSTKAIHPWMAQLPDDLKTDPELGDYKSLAGYVRAMKGKADGNEEEEGETELQYNFEKTIAEDSDPFGEVTKELKDYLRQSKVPEDVAEGLFDKLNDAESKSAKKLIEKGGKWVEEKLKKEWGDDYEKKRKDMTRAYKTLVEPGSDLARGLDRTGASINPFVAEIFSRIGENIKEDGNISSNQTGGGKPAGGVPVDYSKPSS